MYINKLISSIAFGLCLIPSLFFGSLADMTLEEKVGQLLMVHFVGETANEDARVLIKEVKVGGIIYFNWTNGLTSPGQIRQLSESLQSLASIPLLIAADQEGGVVARATRGFTIFPGNKALAVANDPNLAEEAAFAMGEELLSVGINMNLSPVVDVNVNPRNPVIGVRSFGETPETVVLFGKKVLAGFKRAGMISTLKHFPGHGDVEIDSHEDLPILRKSLEELKNCEMLPFAKLCIDADAVMTGHLLVPALDPEHCSTLSEKTLSVLRKFPFEGLIITDSLVMEGVLKQAQNVEEAAICSLSAGADILLLGGTKSIDDNGTRHGLNVEEIQKIHLAIVKAVNTGRVLEKRVDEAVEKILQVKNRYLIHPSPTSRDGKKNGAIAEKIAKLSIQIVRKSQNAMKMKECCKILFVAPGFTRESMSKISASQFGDAAFWFMKGLAPTENEIETAKALAKESDAIIVCSYNAWKNRAQENFIQELLGLGKKSIVLCVRDPLDASLYPNADVVLNTFSPTHISIQAALEVIALL